MLTAKIQNWFYLFNANTQNKPMRKIQTHPHMINSQCDHSQLYMTTLNTPLIFITKRKMHCSQFSNSPLQKFYELKIYLHFKP